MQDVWIDFRSDATGRDERLHALWAASDNPKAPVLLYLHGARWNVTGSAFRIRRMQELGFSVLGVEYRGFGKSSPGLPGRGHRGRGRPCRMAMAGAAAPPQRERYIFGHSLGGAIAIDLASRVDGRTRHAGGGHVHLHSGADPHLQVGMASGGAAGDAAV